MTMVVAVIAQWYLLGRSLIWAAALGRRSQGRKGIYGTDWVINDVQQWQSQLRWDNEQGLGFTWQERENWKWGRDPRLFQGPPNKPRWPVQTIGSRAGCRANCNTSSGSRQKTWLGTVYLQHSLNEDTDSISHSKFGLMSRGRLSGHPKRMVRATKTCWRPHSLGNVFSFPTTSDSIPVKKEALHNTGNNDPTFRYNQPLECSSLFELFLGKHYFWNNKG